MTVNNTKYSILLIIPLILLILLPAVSLAYDFGNAPTIIRDISEDMGVKIALTSWEHGMIPGMINSLQDYCDLTDSNRLQKL